MTDKPQMNTLKWTLILSISYFLEATRTEFEL